MVLTDNNNNVQQKKYWHQRPVYEYDQTDLAINGFVRDCETCDGDGVIRESGEDGGGDYFESEEDCPTCGGTGQVGVMKY